MDRLPLVPTTVVGSHSPPGWLLLAIDAARRGETGVDDLEEAIRDATDIAISDQRRAGIDVITDGEMRRHDFNLGFYARLSGIEPLPLRRRLGPDAHDQRGKWRCAGPLSAPDGLGCVADFSYVVTVSAAATKACVPGPFTLAGRLEPAPTYASRMEVAWALAPIVNAECRALVEAGATLIQVDEPSIAVYPEFIDDVVALFDAAVEGVEATIAAHFCFGNYRARPVARRTYRPIVPRIFDMRIDQYVVEFANREMSELELWRELPPDRTLVAGVIDVKNSYCEPPDLVTDRIRRMLDVVPPERLWLAPDCGFSQTARWIARRKLEALAEGARRVRHELEGSA